MNPKNKVVERVKELPEGVRDCERCGGTNTMQIRRSSLNEGFMADDITLKCEDCYYVATHGVPFDDPVLFKMAMDNRNGRVLDFGSNLEGDKVSENLEALGYIAKSKEVK